MVLYYVQIHKETVAEDDVTLNFFWPDHILWLVGIIEFNRSLSPRLYFLTLQTIKMILSRPMKFVFMSIRSHVDFYFFFLFFLNSPLQSIRISLACLIRNLVQKEINRLRIGNTCKNEGKILISSFQILLSIRTSQMHAPQRIRLGTLGYQFTCHLRLCTVSFGAMVWYLVFRSFMGEVYDFWIQSNQRGG